MYVQEEWTYSQFLWLLVELVWIHQPSPSNKMFSFWDENLIKFTFAVICELIVARNLYQLTDSKVQVNFNKVNYPKSKFHG